MVTADSVDQQLRRIEFKTYGWGRAEVNELHRILLPDEQIFECVNGLYEAGFALLVATDIRVLLIDKKPLNYLTVEDLRFDMINEMDYSHRLFGAQINIATGNKTLVFRSYNQPRLRKLIGHVQHCMAEAKKQVSSHQEDQNGHLEQINQRLQAYLVSQQQQQIELQRLQMAQQVGGPPAQLPEPIKPDPELADFLFAQSLLAQHQAETGRNDLPIQTEPLQTAVEAQQPAWAPPGNSQIDEIYSDGMQEVFGKQQAAQPVSAATVSQVPVATPTAPVQQSQSVSSIPNAALKIAYSKLPMALRNRKFGRPSFHAHSQSEAEIEQAPPAPAIY